MRELIQRIYRQRVTRVVLGWSVACFVVGVFLGVVTVLWMWAQ